MPFCTLKKIKFSSIYLKLDLISCLPFPHSDKEKGKTQQSSKCKFELTGPNKILEFIFICIVLQKTEKFTGPNKVFWAGGPVLIVRTGGASE